MFVLHGLKISATTQRAYACLLEMGLVEGKDFTFEAVALDQLKSPEVLSHQPFGQVPWFIDADNNMEIYESRAIARYVARLVKSPLLPAYDDIKAWTMFDQATSFENYDYEQWAFAIVNECLYKGFHNTPINKEHLEYACKMLNTRLQGYERILSTRKYLAGDKLTIVDLGHLPYGSTAMQFGHAKELTDETNFPNVARWWKSISSLESWKATEKWAQS